ncbi:MAG: nitrite/sulfite reductase [Candidatus Omnitrophica bacterium]|nr:nitrite/sulfite reductase [Candidatus Omnitrophota bacterium]
MKTQNTQRESEAFRHEIELLKTGQIPEDLFRSFRLQHGIYGQRQPGVQMIRVKIPGGGLNAAQIECIADLAESLTNSIAHVTTRQDIQIHWVKLETVPGLMERLAAVGLTTREACGNTVRNITACPMAGVVIGEPFDVTPHSLAMAQYLLRNPICQNMPRKFKPAFSGCPEDCALTSMHDIGYTARQRGTTHGYAVYVGGGLGSSPHSAKLLEEFVPVEELARITEAVIRVFHREGNRKDRGRARIKFVVARMGIDEFRRHVQEELKVVTDDPRWMELVHEFEKKCVENPPKVAAVDPKGVTVDGVKFAEWQRTNIRSQKQSGYVMVHVVLPIGDITSHQLRGLAGIVRRYTGDHVRATIKQNFLLRWVPQGSLPALYADLEKLGLSEPGAEKLTDVTSCPGADTCNLGVTSSKGLARAIRRAFADGTIPWGKDLENLRINISGCPNSCGQHHLADIGFFGGAGRNDGRSVPYANLLLGGSPKEGNATFSQLMLKVPSKRGPQVVKKILELYRAERKGGETFTDFVQRIGKERVKQELSEFTAIAGFDSNPDDYNDWGQKEQFVLHQGVGECAGVEMQATSKFSEAENLLLQSENLFRFDQFTDTIARSIQAIVSMVNVLVRDEGLDPKSEQESLNGYKEKLASNPVIPAKFKDLDRFIKVFEIADGAQEDAKTCLASAMEFLGLCKKIAESKQTQPKA